MPQGPCSFLCCWAQVTATPRSKVLILAPPIAVAMVQILHLLLPGICLLLVALPLWFLGLKLSQIQPTLKMLLGENPVTLNPVRGSNQQHLLTALTPLLQHIQDVLAALLQAQHGQVLLNPPLPKTLPGQLHLPVLVAQDLLLAGLPTNLPLNHLAQATWVRLALVQSSRQVNCLAMRTALSMATMNLRLMSKASSQHPLKLKFQRDDTLPVNVSHHILADVGGMFFLIMTTCS